MKKITLLIFSLCFLFPSYSYKELPVQHAGRIKPLDSFARNLLLQFYGKSEIKKVDSDSSNISAVDWLYLVMTNPELEMDRQVFNIRNPEVSYSLSLVKNDIHKYSFREIIEGFKDNQQLLESLKNKTEEQQTLVEKQVVEVYQNILAYDEVTHAFYCFLPLIEISNKINKEFMGIEHDRMLSYSYFMRNIEKFKYLLQDLLETEESDWTDSHIELSQVAMQLQKMTQFHYAQSVKIIPDNETEVWLSPWEMMDGRLMNDFQTQMLLLYEELIYYYIIQDFNKVEEQSNVIIEFVENNSSVNVNLLNKEVSYNKNNLFVWSIVFYIMSFFCAGISWMTRPNLFRLISLMSIVAGFVLHSYGLVSRMIIMQRPPVTTLYESILFVGFILVLFAIIFEFYRKDTLGILIATTGGSILHFVGFKYALDGDTLGVLVAVLNSNFWLSTHVTTITTGYGVSLVAGLMGHVYLLLAYFKPKDKQLLDKVFNNTYGLTLMGLFFTMFGTILGGIWADQSWGRFWGWDPKENGALLIVLWHLMVLHLRISGLIKPLGYAYAISLVNIVVAIAWFGVNLLNVGLHSYGFTDNVATNLILFIVFELVFTSSFYYLVKKKTTVSI